MAHLARFPPPQLFAAEEPRNSSNASKECKMDPDTLPRPSTHHHSEKSHTSDHYDSDKLTFPPSATSRFSCIDSGNATYRFARLTTNHVPAWPSLNLTATLPLACIFHPFAAPLESEEHIPVIASSSSESVFRCPRCMGFVNPHFTWLDEGRKLKCNLCWAMSDVPPDYYSPINAYGTRQDKFTRPELRCGSVDYVPPPASVNSGSPPVALFVIDSSYLSVKSGFFATTVRSLIAAIPSFPLEMEVGFILFSDSISCVKFELSRNGTPSIITVADVDDPFVPDHSSLLCVSPHLMAEQVASALTLLLSLPRDANPNRIGSCANAAVVIGVEIVAEKGGGSVVLFQSSPCRLGVGAMAESVAIDTAIPQLVQTQQIFVSELEKRCLDHHVCLDVFVCSDPGTKVGVEGLAVVASRTGGELHLLNGLDLEAKIHEWVSVPKYYNCVVRIRTSRGIAVSSLDVSKSIKSGETTMSIPRLSPDSTITTLFSICEAVDPGSLMFLQLVCLFTRADGARLIRVHNVMMNTTGQISHVFKYADVETLGLVMAKTALAAHIDRPNISVKDSLVEYTVKILHAYRTNCAMNSASGQLILPDSLKTLPLMISGVVKQPGIRGDREPVSSDERSLSFWQILGLNLEKAVYTFLPRVFRVYPIPDESSEGRSIQSDIAVLPQLVAASRNKLVASRIYLFDLFDTAVLYIGREVPPGAVEQLLGPEMGERQMDARKSRILDVTIPEESVQTHDWVNRISWIVYTLGRWRRKRLKCVLSRSGGETKISNLLIEDRIGTESGYIDWLCTIHRLIQEKIDFN